jgi:hypothetical protein
MRGTLHGDGRMPSDRRVPKAKSRECQIITHGPRPAGAASGGGKFAAFRAGLWYAIAACTAQ